MDGTVNKSSCDVEALLGEITGAHWINTSLKKILELCKS